MFRLATFLFMFPLLSGFLCSCENSFYEFEYDGSKLSASDLKSGFDLYRITEKDTSVYTNDTLISINLYRPILEEDGYFVTTVSEKTPIILFVHSGAFVVGNKDNYLINQMAVDFARAGYITVSTDYNLIGAVDAVKSSTRKRAIGKAIIDVASVLNHFHRNQDYYGIDEQQIYLCGYSAGGIIVNHLSVSDASEMQDYFGVTSLELDYLREQHVIKKATSISGGIMDVRHLDDNDFDYLDLLVIHGDEDCLIAPLYETPFKNCSEDTEALLPSYVKGTNGPNKIFIPRWLMSYPIELILSEKVCGSRCIYDRGPGHNPTYINILGGEHTFMTVDDGSAFSVTYRDVRDEIFNFFY